MREIKFRAYSETSGIQYIDSLYWFEENGVLDYKGNGHYEKYILMQYTGLKDCNGVEIYEGDLMKRPDSETIFIIVFNNGCFCTQDSKNLHHNLGLLGSINSFSKVIGNIYENKELLE